MRGELDMLGGKVGLNFNSLRHFSMVDDSPDQSIASCKKMGDIG